MEFYGFIAVFPFLKDKKLKKLVVALKCLYSLSVSSLNFNKSCSLHMLE